MDSRSRSRRRPPPLPQEPEPRGHDTEEFPAVVSFDEETPKGESSEEPPDLAAEEEPTAEAGALADAGGTVPDYRAVDAGGGKTEIMQVAGEEQEPPPQPEPLVLVETADGHRSEVSISGGRLVIGRAPECDLVLPDQLVSRTHAVIELGPQGWTILDQQSGNGTFLNGKRVTDSLLKDGDIITLGKARLTFTIFREGEEGGALAKTTLLNTSSIGGTAVSALPQMPAKKRRLLLIVAAVAALVGVASIIKVATRSRGPSPEEIARRQRLEREQEQQRRAAELFELLKQVAAESKWVEATPLLVELEQLRPNDPTVLEYRQTIDRETKSEKLLLEAQARLAVDDFDAALGLLSQVPPESLQVEKAKELRTRVAQKKIASLLAAARARLQEKDPDQAMALADQALQLEPENQVADALKHEAERLLAQKTGGEKKTPKVTKTTPVVVSKDSSSLLRGEALAAYLRGDIDQALSQAPTSGVSEEGLNQLRKFEKLYRHGLELASNPGLAGKATEFLLQAEQLDAKLGGGGGKLVKEIREKLSRSYFVTAVDAHNRKRYPEAFQAYKNALKYNPQLEQAKKRLEELSREAKKLYETAYIYKSNSPDKALEMCGTVMKMVEPDNYAYDRCKKLVTSLQANPSSSAGQEEDF